MSLVEVRDYTIEAERFDEYKVWATEHAAPWLRANLDVIDFWLDSGIEAEVTGSAPQVSSHGQANICWIIRWADEAERTAGFKSFRTNAEWQTIWSKHPCPDAYLHMNARFMKAA